MFGLSGFPICRIRYSVTVISSRDATPSFFPRQPYSDRFSEVETSSEDFTSGMKCVLQACSRVGIGTILRRKWDEAPRGEGQDCLCVANRRRGYPINQTRGETNIGTMLPDMTDEFAPPKEAGFQGKA
jgi:hypothetical protein